MLRYFRPSRDRTAAIISVPLLLLSALCVGVNVAEGKSGLALAFTVLVAWHAWCLYDWWANRP